MKKTTCYFFGFFYIFNVVLISSETASAKPPFIGVFSNKAEGFSTKTIMLMDNGKGMVCGEEDVGL